MTMPSIARAAVGAAVVLLAAGTAQAGPASAIDFGLLLPAVSVSCGGSGPTATAAAACDGSVTPVPLALSNFRTQTLSDGSARLDLIAPVELLIGDGSVRISDLQIVANADPFITYSIALTNATLNTFNVAITASSLYLGGPYNTAAASMTVTATDGGRDGVTVGLVDPTLAHHLINGVDAGLDLLGAACTSVCSDSATTTGAFSASGTLFAVTRFTLTPQGDSAAIVGSFEITNTTVTAPAPATMALFGLGLAGLGLARRRR